MFRLAWNPNLARKMLETFALLCERYGLWKRQADDDDRKQSIRRESKDSGKSRVSRPLRRLRRPLRSGNADGRARRTGARIRKGQTQSQISRTTRSEERRGGEEGR